MYYHYFYAGKGESLYLKINMTKEQLSNELKRFGINKIEDDLRIFKSETELIKFEPIINLEISND